MPHDIADAPLPLEISELKAALARLKTENELLRSAILRYGSGRLALRQVDRTVAMLRDKTKPVSHSVICAVDSL